MSVPLDLGRKRGLTPLQEQVPLSEKLEQITAWIDLPLEKRPQFIAGLSLVTGCRIWQLMDYF